MDMRISTATEGSGIETEPPSPKAPKPPSGKSGKSGSFRSSKLKGAIVLPNSRAERV